MVIQTPNPNWRSNWGAVLIPFALLLSACEVGGGIAAPPASLKSSAGDETARGLAAQLGGNDTEAAQRYRQAAKGGDPAAPYYLGVLYENGRGVASNRATAIGWYRLAAERGFPQAYYRLGVMYYHGLGLPQNSTVAARWFHKAAARGHRDAQRALGRLYALGDGVPKDLAASARWLAREGSRRYAFRDVEDLWSNLRNDGNRGEPWEREPEDRQLE